MLRLELGCIALLSITMTTACANDSRSTEVAAPDAVAGATNAARGDDDDSDGDSDDAVDIQVVKIEDACDPDDPTWNTVGGCMQPRGSVTLAEFNAELDSPLSTAVVGHPSWRNDPAYGVIRAGQTIRVRNTGGRAHTFTRVAAFGGGKIPNPALNEGLVTAPECPGSVDVPPGGRAEVAGLAAGSHRFQCCIHPWMRAVVEVRAR